MSFKYSVIGDNTIENREHLEKVGYNMSMFTMDKSLLLKTQTNGEYYETNKDDWSEAIVNCIGNPQLFQAVSAMRDDSDYMQLFYSKETNKWYRCEQQEIGTHFHVMNYHKATLSELQSHFQRV